LSLGEVRLKAVRFASSEVAVSYPRALDSWFDGLAERCNESTAPRKWVHLCAHREAGHFNVATSIDAPAAGLTSLDLGEALAVFWERVSFLLVDDIRDAIVLHAAALCKDNCFILLPGGTGSGKTRLSLWYRAQGLELGTDEIVALGRDELNDLVLAGALARPLMLKASADISPSLRATEAPLAQQDSSCGLMLRLAGGAPWSRRTIERGFIVFPSFNPNAPFELRALTPGEASLRVIENCLNARNLPRGGLPFASLLARRVQAISLVYGATDELMGTLDVLTRQVLATPTNADDVAALCEAFTARARAQTVSATQNGTTKRPLLVETPKRVIPASTAARFPRRLTIGMATFDDYDGVYFTIQSIRISNPELDGTLEFVVIDNNPGGPCSEALSDLSKWVDGYRYVPRGEWSGTAMRNAVFEEASSPFVLCIDSHVFIVPGALSKLIAYFEADRESADLLQGPMMYDDLHNTATHMEPRWRAGMYGTWETDPRGVDPTAPNFDIPMHGLGLFACRRNAWPGFHPHFRGFGGEEGYIHEKIRQRGGRTLCLPFLRWLHRFNRPLGMPYETRWEDRMRNYLIGFDELGLDTAEMEAHFAELIGVETSSRIFTEIKLKLGIGRPT
jgi:Glycosyl transferase family 2